MATTYVTALMVILALVRRIGEVSKLFIEAGIIVLTAFISPFREERKKVRSMMPHGDFIEIYVECPIKICESRDVKGLYQKARDGEIDQFTGISSPYEPPDAQELTINTSQETLKESTMKILNLLKERGILHV